MPLVSIIIPCYNQGVYLKDALTSCLTQTYPQLEIIVVDDGSTDNTREIAMMYPQVRYLYQDNHGPGSARNRGFQNSKGDLIQFLDADDLLLPTKIERCVEGFQQDSDAAVVYSDYMICSHDLTECW